MIAAQQEAEPQPEAPPAPVVEPVKAEEPQPKVEETAKVAEVPKVEPKDDLGDLLDEMQKRKVTGNGETLQLEERTLHMLVKLEQEWGEQLEIKWGKRDKALNTEIGGRSHSQHLKGKAVDIMHNGWDQAKMRKFIRLAYDVGFRGFGTGKTMIHIDSRDKLGAWLYPGSPYPSARKILRDKVKG
jgi:uncharacterized protein YcbK (DUF882 family)